MAPPTLTEDITALESELDNQRSEAFFSLTRVAHMSAPAANALASTYRAALSSHALMRQQAGDNDIEALKLYLLYAGGAFATAGGAELALSFAARVAGMAKWMVLFPALGISARLLLQKRSGKEILEFVFGEGKGEGDGEKGDGE